MQKIICFGEILWDNFPSGPLPGGAPMNVCYHLHNLGMEPVLVSATGSDAEGRELKSFLEKKGVPTNFVQENQHHATGQVKVSFNNQGEPAYDIVFPAAWDFIHKPSSIEWPMVQAIVYGSLAARNEKSRSTIQSMLYETSYKVMDINLRYPHYSPEVILALASQADLLKVNQDELKMVCEWLGITQDEEEEKAKKVMKIWDLKEVIITKGGEGSSLYSKNGQWSIKPPKVKIVDTVGSGDSFLAGYLSKRLTGSAEYDALKFATALASLVTARSGACPDYSIEEINVSF